LIEKREAQRRLVQEFKEIKELEKIKLKEKEDYDKQIMKKTVKAEDKARIKAKEDELVEKKLQYL
jgi:hypothetical protein